ncbi:uncharacterized protein SPSK_01144 [Sporothrix schenckii 1099-18]|uniref:Alternative oxidase n=2 Tax=Sporothrix schenckii TaxID=29908 RepID=U7PMG4_SPOS1|nr:uncharacterized protein SPSK_01144 [Sporothrix schenckii 1099-18]ERS96767.1 hypothetical protein HMPREF1624_06976 [Sporothrix schenckii ATCC 58251]KJR81491.1 hypothetical protein SPSK_01144 [Sporothrix schenckii 1099-18]
MFSRRSGLATSLLLALVLIWSFKLLPLGEYQSYPADAWNSAKESITGVVGSGKPGASTSKHVQNYFDQVFGAEKPPIFPFTELRAACAAADFEENEAYVNCVAITAGMTSIMSQVKVCFKMAIETGSHILLPTMPLRDSKNLLDFNFFNGDAYMPYDEWYDMDHLRTQMAEACPKMKILHPDDINPDKGGTVAVRRRFEILCSEVPFYEKFHSYFWVGRPYSKFFREQFKIHMDRLAEEEAKLPEPVVENGGITLVNIDSEFLVFRITDDPTRRDLRLWTELSHLIRFREDVRTVVQRLVDRLPNAGNYMGVHFRAENDSIWSSPEHQLGVDLDALDRAWDMFGNYGEEKPPVYLACGDQEQIEMFSKAAAERGWSTTHKWQLATLNDDTETAGLINKMAFDFQGAIDMGIMARSRFFIGVQGSAFSSTVGNHRDITGRYRGSSFEVPDDGARTHLFNDLDATEYQCCL